MELIELLFSLDLVTGGRPIRTEKPLFQGTAPIVILVQAILRIEIIEHLQGGHLKLPDDLELVDVSELLGVDYLLNELVLVLLRLLAESLS